MKQLYAASFRPRFITLCLDWGVLVSQFPAVSHLLKKYPNVGGALFQTYNDLSLGNSHVTSLSSTLTYVLVPVFDTRIRTRVERCRGH